MICSLILRESSGGNREFYVVRFTLYVWAAIGGFYVLRYTLYVWALNPNA